MLYLLIGPIVILRLTGAVTAIVRFTSRLIVVSTGGRP